VNNRANAFSQPANKRVNLSAHPVTPLANNASVAPGWPAGYAQRSMAKI